MIHPALTRTLEKQHTSIATAASLYRQAYSAWGAAGASLASVADLKAAEHRLNAAVEDATCGLGRS